MPTRRFEQIALAQLLGAFVFSACVLIDHAQAQPGYVPPPTPLPPPVFNPSSPNVVPQPSYRSITFQIVRLRRLRMKSFRARSTTTTTTEATTQVRDPR